MRATKAKALRRAMGFKPSAPREFSHDRMIEKSSIVNGRPTRYVVTGTVTATGAHAVSTRPSSAVACPISF